MTDYSNHGSYTLSIPKEVFLSIIRFAGGVDRCCFIPILDSAKELVSGKYVKVPRDTIAQEASYSADSWSFRLRLWHPSFPPVVDGMPIPLLVLPVYRFERRSVTEAEGGTKILEDPVSDPLYITPEGQLAEQSPILKHGWQPDGSLLLSPEVASFLRQKSLSVRAGGGAPVIFNPTGGREYKPTPMEEFVELIRDKMGILEEEYT